MLGEFDMMSELVLLCPGQGAQKAGMGKAWFDYSDASKLIFERADEIMGDSLGLPLSTICFDDPKGEINQTNISQPAIYTCSIAAWHGLLAEGLVGDIKATAGLSLGEYSALHLAGVFSFEEGLSLVAQRGALMQDAAEAQPSTMVAVMGDDDAILKLCEDARGEDILVPANFNAPGQIVLSGSVEACERAASLAGDAELRATPLSVAGAFHSPFMQSAADAMAEALDGVDFNNPEIDVWSNVTGKLHDSECIKERLVEQITGSVQWSQSSKTMASEYDGCDWHELAPSGILRGLMRRIERTIKVIPHDEPTQEN